jgi:hypothetical protein
VPTMNNGPEMASKNVLIPGAAKKSRQASMEKSGQDESQRVPADPRDFRDEAGEEQQAQDDGNQKEDESHDGGEVLQNRREGGHALGVGVGLELGRGEGELVECDAERDQEVLDNHVVVQHGGVIPRAEPHHDVLRELVKGVVLVEE